MLSVRWKRRGGLASAIFIISGKVDKHRCCMRARNQAEICASISTSLEISAADIGMSLGDSVRQAKETGRKIQLPALTDLVARAAIAKKLIGSEAR